MEDKHAPHKAWMTRSGVMLDYMQPTVEQKATMQIGNPAIGGGVQKRADMHPLLHADVPKGKFMQAMNFDKLVGQENGNDAENDDSIKEENIDNCLGNEYSLMNWAN